MTNPDGSTVSVGDIFPRENNYGFDILSSGSTASSRTPSGNKFTIKIQDVITITSIDPIPDGVGFFYEANWRGLTYNWEYFGAIIGTKINTGGAYADRVIYHGNGVIPGRTVPANVRVRYGSLNFTTPF